MKKLFIVMLSVFALMLVGCSNSANSSPANSGPTSDPYLLGLDNCEVTLAEIEAGVQDDWEYTLTNIIGDTTYPSSNNFNGAFIKAYNIGTDFKYYANADFSTIVMKWKFTSGNNGYNQCIKISE